MIDFEWTFPAPPAGSTPDFHHRAPTDSDFNKVTTNKIRWGVQWDHEIPAGNLDSDAETKPGLLLAELLALAYLTDGASPPSPIAEPAPLMSRKDTLVDERVQNPTDAAFESAVRGALAQVTSPFFKFDENSLYDQSLRTAFKSDTTIYHPDGSTANLSDADRQAVASTKSALQLRGKILHDMIRDVQAFASLDGRIGSAADMNQIVARVARLPHGTRLPDHRKARRDSLA